MYDDLEFNIRNFGTLLIICFKNLKLYYFTKTHFKTLTSIFHNKRTKQTFL